MPSCLWSVPVRARRLGRAWPRQAVTDPLHSLLCSLPTGQEDGTHPEATSAADSHRLPPRPAWGEDMPVASGWPDAGGRLVESQIPVDPGNRTRQQRSRTDGHSVQGALATWGSTRLEIRQTCVLANLARAVQQSRPPPLPPCLGAGGLPTGGSPAHTSTTISGQGGGRRVLLPVLSLTLCRTGGQVKGGPIF